MYKLLILIPIIASLFAIFSEIMQISDHIRKQKFLKIFIIITVIIIIVILLYFFAFPKNKPNTETTIILPTNIAPIDTCPLIIKNLNKIKGSKELVNQITELYSEGIITVSKNKITDFTEKNEIYVIIINESTVLKFFLSRLLTEGEILFIGLDDGNKYSSLNQFRGNRKIMFQLLYLK